MLPVQAERQDGLQGEARNASIRPEHPHGGCGVSRDDDDDPTSDGSSPYFNYTDNPGIGNLQDGDLLEQYQFTAEQIVYSPGSLFKGDPIKKTADCDCEKNPQVAKRGPHTATLKGPATAPGPFSFDGVPATSE